MENYYQLKIMDLKIYIFFLIVRLKAFELGIGFKYKHNSDSIYSRVLFRYNRNITKNY